MSEQQYTYLTDEDTIQAGDEFWTGSVWLEYDADCVGKFVLVDPSRRPIANAIDQPQRERIAYEELQAGDLIQPGDEWQNPDGRWHPLVLMPESSTQVRDNLRARRPHNITALEKYRCDLIDDIQHVIGERDEARKQRDLARSEVARLSTGLWARKPLEDRVASLTDELAQAREANQQLLQTIADNADQFADAGKILEQQRDEARAERDKLKGLIDDLLDEPTARQVRDMLRTWLTELDWSTGCFGSFGRSQIEIIEQTMVAVINRISSMIDPEGDSDDN